MIQKKTFVSVGGNDCRTDEKGLPKTGEIVYSIA